MICTIVWNSLNFSEWNTKFNKVSQSTITQSCNYARALCPLYGQKSRSGLIMIDDQEAGIVQIQEASVLKNMIHAVILDRGPLWFDEFGSAQHFEAFVKAFNQQFPRRFGRRRRFIPEFEDSSQIQQIMSNNGFRVSAAQAYQTLWLDLRPSLEHLRAGLKKKWRNALSKAERSGIQMTWDERGVTLPLLLSHYEQDKRERNYAGPDAKVIMALAKTFGPAQSLIIGWAHDPHGGEKDTLEGERIAGILLLCHGRSCTYQIGWTSRAGRAHNAHHLLLWQSLEKLTGMGLNSFDLGGVHDEAPGLKAFKEGMGGERATLPGIYS